MKQIVVIAVVTQLSSPILANETHDHTSHYAGQEKRAIKSLSADDMAELESGGGWGLAKAAELNGVPGPRHLLEMKQEISLTEQQVQQIEAAFDAMQAKAITLGNRYIALEQELENQFQAGSMNAVVLKALLQQLAGTHADLRFVHLAAHLEMENIVTDEQVALYNNLRGYTSTDGSDPCNNVPEGHDPDMWKKHNGC